MGGNGPETTQHNEQTETPVVESFEQKMKKVVDAINITDQANEKIGNILDQDFGKEIDKKSKEDPIFQKKIEDILQKIENIDFSNLPETTNEADKASLNDLKTFLSSHIETTQKQNEYSAEDYTKDKNTIINYLNDGGIGRGGKQEFTEDSLELIFPELIESTVFLYNTDIKNKPIDYENFIKEFTTNHQNKLNNIGDENPKSSDTIKEDNPGQVRDLLPNEIKSIEQNIINFALDKESGMYSTIPGMNISIVGSADADLPNNTEFKKDTKYLIHRENLLRGCTPNIAENLSKVFPAPETFNEKNKNDLNRGFALSRAMQQLQILPDNIKNTILDGALNIGPITNTDEFSYIQQVSIGKVDFSIQVANQENRDFTFGRTKIISTGGPTQERYEDLIKNYSNKTITIGVNTGKKPGMTNDNYVSTNSADITLNANGATKKPGGGTFTDAGLASNYKEDLNNVMRLNFSISDIKNPDYTKYFDIPKNLDISSVSDEDIRIGLYNGSIQMKPISPEEALTIYKQKQSDETKKDQAERIKTFISHLDKK